MPARGPTIVGVLIFLFFLSPLSVFAVSVSIINFPSTITVDPFSITASISGAASGTNYLRVDLYKEGTSNYFGETYNGSDWCSSSNGKEYLPVTIQSGKFWSGDIQARTGEISTSNYDGQGTYKIRLRRYTSSGGSNTTEADGSSVTITINIPTSTPAPTVVPTHPPPTSTSVPTSTAAITATPVVSNSVTPSVRPTSYVQILSQVTIEDEMASDGAVLGETHDRQNASGSTDMLAQKRPYIIALLFASAGLALLAAVSVVKIRYTKKV